MDNIEILAKFQELKYKEQLDAVEHQDQFRNGDMVSLAHQAREATASLADSARNVICQLEPLQGTAFCSVQVA